MRTFLRSSLVVGDMFGGSGITIVQCDELCERKIIILMVHGYFINIVWLVLSA